MYLTYEETMRRIDEYDRADVLGRKLPRENEMPYHISVYQGEGQMLIVPMVFSTCGLYSEMARYWKLEELENVSLIGRIIQRAFSYIHQSPIDARTRAEKEADSIIKNATTCKSYKTFNKRYSLCMITQREDGIISIGITRRLTQIEGYGGYDKPIVLPATATAENIGNAIMQSFAKMEEADKTLKKCPPSKPRTTIELLSSNKLSFEDLQDNHYVDEQDYGSAEIYQGYSYYKESPDDSVAELYYSIASELDSDISSDNIRKVYSGLYGADALIEIKEISHRVFEKRVEVIGKEIHHIIYVKQVDESELLACELRLKIKPAGKRIYAKVLKDFEKLVESTRME